MPSYFKRYSGMSRGITDGASKKTPCTGMTEYYCQDVTGLCSVSVYEDGFVYLSPVPTKSQLERYTFSVPVGAVPCHEAEYTAAHALYVQAEKKRKLELAKEEAFVLSLKKGMMRNAHAAEEADAAEPELAAAHFLDDFTILDFETSDSYAIELAAVRVQGWQITSQLQSFIQFRGQLNTWSAQLTGITSADLWNAPTEKTVLQQFKQLAGDSLLVAHNAVFDLRHLEAARTRQGAQAPLPNKSLCTVVVAKARYPAPHKLGALCERFGIAVVGAHRALNDVLMTHQLLRCMHEQEPIDPCLIGATSAAKAKRKATTATLFATV